jgi:hypothetical protein
MPAGEIRACWCPVSLARKKDITDQGNIVWHDIHADTLSLSVFKPYIHAGLVLGLV